MAPQTSTCQLLSPEGTISAPSLVILNKAADGIEVFDLLGRPLDMQLTIGLSEGYGSIRLGSTLNIDISKPFAIDNTTLQYYSVSSEVILSSNRLPCCS